MTNGAMTNGTMTNEAMADGGMGNYLPLLRIAKTCSVMSKVGSA
jgi:hypothetical protein